MSTCCYMIVHVTEEWTCWSSFFSPTSASSVKRLHPLFPIQFLQFNYRWVMARVRVKRSIETMNFFREVATIRTAQEILAAITTTTEHEGISHKSSSSSLLSLYLPFSLLLKKESLRQPVYSMARQDMCRFFLLEREVEGKTSPKEH